MTASLVIVSAGFVAGRSILAQVHPVEGVESSRVIANLGSGDNGVTVLADTTAVLLEWPDDNTVVTKLKQVTGDTGIVLHATEPTLLSVATSVTSFILNCSGAVSATITLI